MSMFSEIIDHPVRRLPVHKEAHFDELIAATILKRFGQSYFPGIQDARLECWDGMPEGKSWEDLFFNYQILPVGMGFSPLDEHLPDGTRIPNECAATLAAKAVDLWEDRALMPLLKFTLRRDTSACGNQFEFPSHVKTMWKSGRTLSEVSAFVENVFDDIHGNGLSFTECQVDIEKSTVSKIETVRGEVVLVVGYSDIPEFGNYARSRRGHRAGVAMWQKSSGEIVIQARNELQIDLAPAMQMIRYEELKSAGLEIPSWEILASPGTLPQCPQWFFFVAENGNNMILPRAAAHQQAFLCQKWPRSCGTLCIQGGL